MCAEAFLRGDFLSPGNLSALLLDNAYLLILAVGMTFVILTAGIDLSVGSVMAFTGILGAQLLANGVPAWLAVVVMLAGGAVIGLLIGVLVQYFSVQPFIASLAGLFLAAAWPTWSACPRSGRGPGDPVAPEEPDQAGRLTSDPAHDRLLAVAVAAFALHLNLVRPHGLRDRGQQQSARLMGLDVAAPRSRRT